MGPRRSPLSLLYVTLGWLSLGLGAAGVFLPLLPTVPFVLLAAWCFSKGSPRLHAWLLSRPRLGPVIRSWNEHGSIPKRAKWLATGMLVGLFGVGQWVGRARRPEVMASIPPALWLLVVAILGAVLLFIWTRPTDDPS